MPFSDQDLVAWFVGYEKPEGSVEARAHVIEAESNCHLQSFMSAIIPSCYISSEDLETQKNNTGLSAEEIIANKMPDPGSVMAGDFGEILTLYFLSGESTDPIKRVKKWRFKQDRTKAAPHTDVVLLFRADATCATVDDYVLCAEAKLKSTRSAFSPIENSIKGYESDKTGRLARTLVWLKEKAIDHENAESIDFVKRFTDESLNTSFRKRFRAVAVIERDYLDSELVKELNLPPQSDDFEVIVLGVNSLKDTYEYCFANTVNEIPDE